MQRNDLISYLSTIAKPGMALDELADQENLFDSGILDSLAVIQIIMFLEQEYGVNLAAKGIDPAQLGTIEGILNAAQTSSI